MKHLLQRAFLGVGYRIIHARQRWGIDVVDDLKKLDSIAGYRTIFDVGANCGQTASRFARAFPQATIYSFEPFPESFEKLNCLARYFTGRMIPVNLALSEKAGTASLRAFGDSEKNTVVPEMADSMRRDERLLTVQTETVDGFCAERGIREIDLLKIDVEGAEMRVLAGAHDMLKAGRVRFVYAEFHVFSKEGEGATRGHTALDELAQFLQGFGMRALCVYTDGVHLHEPIGTYNAFFGREPLGTADLNS